MSNFIPRLIKDLPLTNLYLTTTGDQNTLSLVPNRSWKNPSSSRKRKLPRDLELTSDLYTITNSLQHNYTNNAISTVSSFSQFPRATPNTMSLERIQTNDEIDSSV